VRGVACKVRALTSIPRSRIKLKPSVEDPTSIEQWTGTLGDSFMAGQWSMRHMKIRPHDNTDTVLFAVVCNTDIEAPHQEHCSQDPQGLCMPWNVQAFRNDGGIVRNRVPRLNNEPLS